MGILNEKLSSSLKELEKLKVVEIDQFEEEKTIMCTLKKYREHDPNTIEAVQFTGENGNVILNLLNVRGGVWTTLKREFDEDTGEEFHKRVLTLEIIDGSKRCRAFQGDYVLKTVHGEIYTLDDESFLICFEEI